MGYETRGCRRMCATKRRHPPDIGETRAYRERPGATKQQRTSRVRKPLCVGTCPTQSECQREAESCIPFKTLPMPPPTVVGGGMGMAWPRPVARLAQYPYAFGNYPGECRWRVSSANWRHPCCRRCRLLSPDGARRERDLGAPAKEPLRTSRSRPGEVRRATGKADRRWSSGSPARLPRPGSAHRASTWRAAAW